MNTCCHCKHLDLHAAEKIKPGSARMGLAKCGRQDMGKATFITTTYARECASFEPAAADVVAKRVEWIG